MGYNPFSHFNILSTLIYVFLFLVIGDFFIYKGFKIIFGSKKNDVLRKILISAHIISSLFFMLFFWILFLVKKIPCDDYITLRSYYSLLGLFILLYIPKALWLIFIFFHYLLVLSRFVLRLFNKEQKSREKLTQNFIIVKTSMILSFLLFLFFLHGMVINKFNYKVVEQVIYIDNLPPSFENYRIVQLSDLHLGSFRNKRPVEKIIRIINKLKPDMFVFTGDIKNLVAEETYPYISCFNKLDNNFLKFSVTGNHDYGDYAACLSVTQKNLIIINQVKAEKEMGFRVLLNESVIIKKNNDSIALIGVENWGPLPFKKYGNLEKAISAVKLVKPKILLSHDPDHWTQEVVPKYDIDLTLSGHTHAMQMGIKIGQFKWSPSKYRYPNWGGLYQNGHKQNYVNRGAGYLGFPGRIGLRPEITLIILKKAK